MRAIRRFCWTTRLHNSPGGSGGSLGNSGSSVSKMVPLAIMKTFLGEKQLGKRLYSTHEQFHEVNNFGRISTGAREKMLVTLAGVRPWGRGPAPGISSTVESVPRGNCSKSQPGCLQIWQDTRARVRQSYHTMQMVLHIQILKHWRVAIETSNHSKVS